MSWWSKIFSRHKKEDFYIRSDPPWGLTTHSGNIVSENSAMTFSAVFAAVRLLSESVGSLPLFLYRRLPSGGKEVARRHPLFSILHSLANPEMHACEFRSLMMTHVLLWGNFYAEIVRGEDGQVTALWPLHPSRVTAKRPSPSEPLIYEISLPSGQRTTTSKQNIFHMRGLSLDGITGISPIRYHKESIALGLSAQEFGARFFGQGLLASGTIEHPAALSDAAYQRLKLALEKQSGLTHAHRYMILEEGAKLNKLTIPPEEAQWLQTRKFQITEIARIFSVPPHMIADLDRATFSNIEEQAIEFVVHSLRPWLVRIEQTIYRDLFDDEEREELFAEFKIDALLRGKTLERYQAYALGRQWGWFSANDIRDLENLNPIDEGDFYLTPLNMSPIGEQPNEEKERKINGHAS